MSKLDEWVASFGGRVAWGPATVLDAVREDMRAQRDAGAFDPTYASEVKEVAFNSSGGTDTLPTVVMVALPLPAYSVTVVHGGHRTRVLLPPTYVRYRPSFEVVRRQLAQRGLPGSRVEALEAPLKATAARLGLARYGRNNLAYVQELGSYVQLYGYATDANLPLVPGWMPSEARLLAECAGCEACRVACPTGAIRDDRLLLHAERCLTYVNESLRPLPEWVPGTAHHCLVGCLRCQRPCPANPRLRIEDSGVTLEEEETAALLADPTGDTPARRAATRKLAALELSFDVVLFGRNLRALVRRGRS